MGQIINIYSKFPRLTKSDRQRGQSPVSAWSRVWLSSRDIKITHGCKKLTHLYTEPYRILQHINEVTYKLCNLFYHLNAGISIELHFQEHSMAYKYGHQELQHPVIYLNVTQLLITHTPGLNHHSSVTSTQNLFIEKYLLNSIIHLIYQVFDLCSSLCFFNLICLPVFCYFAFVLYILVMNHLSFNLSLTTVKLSVAVLYKHIPSESQEKLEPILLTR